MIKVVILASLASLALGQNRVAPPGNSLYYDHDSYSHDGTAQSILVPYRYITDDREESYGVQEEFHNGHRKMHSNVQSNPGYVDDLGVKKLVDYFVGKKGFRTQVYSYEPGNKYQNSAETKHHSRLASLYGSEYDRNFGDRFSKY